MVGHSLQHYRAVDVSVVGVRITEETPYRATLTAIFPDGSRRQRQIEGVVQRIYLDNIRPEYSRVYHIKEASKETTSTTLQPRRPKEDTFHYQEQTHYRDNELREKAEASDQQQLLMPSPASTASRLGLIASQWFLILIYLSM